MGVEAQNSRKIRDIKSGPVLNHFGPLWTNIFLRFKQVDCCLQRAEDAEFHNASMTSTSNDLKWSRQLGLSFRDWSCFIAHDPSIHTINIHINTHHCLRSFGTTIGAQPYLLVFEELDTTVGLLMLSEVCHSRSSATRRAPRRVKATGCFTFLACSGYHNITET